MKIINQTKKTVLAEDVHIADTIFKRLKGLLGRARLNPGEALIIKPCNSIHTLFMQFAIDVLFLDKDNRVVKAISYLAPYRLTPIYFPACMVIELPANTISLTLTEQGDILSLE